MKETTPTIDVNPSATLRSPWRIVLALTLAALALRVYCCTNLACVSRDGVRFVQYAKELAESPIEAMRNTTKQPGYAYLLLGTHAVSGPVLGDTPPLAWERSGQLMALLGGVAVCPLVFLLTRRLFDTFAAIVAGLFVACWPAGAHLSADVLSDMPHLAFYLASLLVAYRAMKEDRLGLLVAAGTLGGLAYLLRQEALVLVPAVAVCWMWPAAGRPMRRRLIGAAVFVLCFAAVVSPHSMATGKLLPNKTPWEMLLGAKTAFASHTPWILAHVIPWYEAPGRMAEEWSRSGRYVISTLFLLGLLLKSAPRAETTGKRLLVVVLVLHLLAVQFRVKQHGEISSRYMVIPFVLTVPWAATGFITFLSILARGLDPRQLRRIAALWVGGLFVALFPLFYYATLPVQGGKETVRAAGQWLNENAQSDDVVLAHDRMEQVLFYADRAWPADRWRRFSHTESTEIVRRNAEITDAGWYVDVADLRQGRIDEAAHFRSLEGGLIPDWVPVWRSPAGMLKGVIFKRQGLAPAADMPTDNGASAG